MYLQCLYFSYYYSITKLFLNTYIFFVSTWEAFNGSQRINYIKKLTYFKSLKIFIYFYFRDVDVPAGLFNVFMEGYNNLEDFVEY